MYTKKRRLIARIVVWLGILLAFLLLALPAHAKVDISTSIEASGEGAIFDVTTNGNGTLQVATKAGRVGDRWRVTIAQANGDGAESAVGSGSSKTFSGWVSYNLKDGINYIVLVTYDRPLPGTFPAKVKVRFAGSTKSSNPPVIPLDGGQLKNIKPRPISPSGGGGGGGGGCPKDGSTIKCGALLTCELKPEGDTDAFKINLPANAVLSTNIAGGSGNKWTVYDPKGKYVGSSYGKYTAAVEIAGIYTVEVSNAYNKANKYTLSVLGVSANYSCGPRIIPGGSPVKDEFEIEGDTDSFLLNGVKAKESYSINIQGGSGNKWTIYSPKGEVCWI